jgi:hypothetical protein
VKSVFLNGKINELVYVKQPPSFEDSKKPNLVYKLSKSLYGKFGVSNASLHSLDFWAPKKVKRLLFSTEFHFPLRISLN